MQGAAKVGFLVVIFVALLYAGYAVLGKALFGGPKLDTYYATFEDASGVTGGTVVSMAGVPIGTVREVQLDRQGQALVILDIRQPHRIPLNSRVRMGGSLIGIGSSPLQVVPPKGPTTAFYPTENRDNPIPGEKASAVDSFLPAEAKDALKELNRTLVATRNLLENKTILSKLEKLIDTSSATLEKFGAVENQAKLLLAKTTSLVGDNQPAIAKAMENASLAMSDIRKSTGLLAKLIESGKYQDQVLSLLKQLNDTAAKADDLMARLNNFVNDPQFQSSMKQTMANVDKMTDSGKVIASNTEVISKNGITLSQKAIELADKANAIADEAKSALEKISSFFNRGGAKPALPKVEAHLDLLRQNYPTHWRTDLYGRFDLGKGFADAGLYDAFESNKVILQMGEPLGRAGDFRYGIYASKPSVGVDFRLAPRVSLRSDLYDINKPQFDIRTQFDFGNGLLGWLGIERIFGRDALVAGVGIKK